MKEKIMKTILSLVMLFAAYHASAQEILVTVSPTQPVLPPQAMMYLDNPSKFFNIRITNLTNKVQNIYLGLDLKQVIPDNRMSMKTPANRFPQHPLTLNPNQTKILTRAEARQMFAHLFLNEISLSGGVLTDYTNGIMALLPEGTYMGHITAYRYDPSLRTPYVLNNPNSGFCQFQICYRAQAPQFLTPTYLLHPSAGLLPGRFEIALLDADNPQFTWTEPAMNCNTIRRYKYSIKSVRLMEGQTHEDALAYNPIVFQRGGLLVPSCRILAPIMRTMFDTESHYVAQVTAEARDGNLEKNFVMIENEGKCEPLTFRLKKEEDKSNLKPLFGGSKEDGETSDEKEGKEVEE